MSECIFCKIVDGTIPARKVFETDQILAILDINPVAPGHTLVMPKGHYEKASDLPEDLMLEFFARVLEVARGVVRGTASEGYNLLCNNHRSAGQAIPHVHFHVIPRKTGDSAGFKWTPGKYAEGELESWTVEIRKALGLGA